MEDQNAVGLHSLISKLFRTIKDSIPALYIALVCIGFLEKGLFFRQFDIDILDYLTIQEMIFMFIPIGSFVITIVFFLTLSIAPIMVFNETSNNTIRRENLNQELSVDVSKQKKGVLNRIKKLTYKIVLRYLYIELV